MQKKTFRLCKKMFFDSILTQFSSYFFSDPHRYRPSHCHRHRCYNSILFLFMSHRMFSSPLDRHFCTMSTISNCIHRSVPAIAKHRKFYIQVSSSILKWNN